MPAHQGSLDGLCGPYAICNALDLCGLGEHQEELFQEACSVPAACPWPSPVWLGTTYADMKRMVRACLRSPLNRLGVTARYPLSRNAPSTNAAFWKRFDDAFSDPRAICGIVGLRKPAAHWVVAIPDGGRVVFVDSCVEQPAYRKNRSALHAGFRRSKPTQWLLDRGELIVFHC